MFLKVKGKKGVGSRVYELLTGRHYANEGVSIKQSERANIADTLLLKPGRIHSKQCLTDVKSVAALKGAIKLCAMKVTCVTTVFYSAF